MKGKSLTECKHSDLAILKKKRSDHLKRTHKISVSLKRCIGKPFREQVEKGLIKPAIIVATALGIIIVAAWVQWKRHLCIRGMFPALTRTEQLLFGSIIVILVITWVSSFAPVTGGITNDEIHTHLSVPAAWLRSGTIEPQTYPVSFMAAHGELLFVFASVFSRGTGPHLVSWFSFCLTIILK